MGWFYNDNLKPQGPVSLEQIRLKIERGEIGPFDLLLSDDEQWRPASDYKEFSQNLFPAWQEWNRAQGDILPLEKVWVLLAFENEASKPIQRGPLSSFDILEELKLKNLDVEKAWVWKNGLSGWAKLVDRPEFRETALMNSL